MKMSDAGLVQLAGLEGIVVAPYRDSVGVMTYGVGHTKAAGGRDPEFMFPGMPEDIDAEIRVALNMFREDVVKYERTVNEAVDVSVTQTEFDALVSFHFNTGGIKRANLTKKLNAGDKDGAAKGFMGWLKPPEIEGRRKKEQRLFANGQYSGDPIPVYGVKAHAQLGKIVKTYSPKEMLDVLREDKEPQPSISVTTQGTVIAALIAAALAGLALFWDKFEAWIGDWPL